LGKCHICRKVFIFIYAEPPRTSARPTALISNGTTHVILEHVYPVSIPEISNDIPPDIVKTYEEGSDLS